MGAIVEPLVAFCDVAPFHDDFLVCGGPGSTNGCSGDAGIGLGFFYQFLSFGHYIYIVPENWLMVERFEPKGLCKEIAYR